MKKTLFAIVGAVMICLSFTPISDAADEYAGYMVFKGGYFGPSQDFQNEDLDGKAYWELALGTDLGMFGVEIGTGYMTTENDVIDVTSIPILLTGRLQFPIDIFCPYLLGGIGLYFTDMEPRGLESENETNFGAHAGAGAEVRLQQLILGIEARYIWVNPDYNDVDVDLNGYTVTGNIGYRF